MIKELTNEEAARLRELVKDRFLQSPYNGAGFRITQFKGSYKALADDIASSIEGGLAAASTNRLRKFFYYTNPEVCDERKLEKPSFGDDFIQTLFKYAGAAPKYEESLKVKVANATTPPFRPKLGMIIILGLLTVAIIALIFFSSKYTPKPWREDFNQISVDGLRSHGWQILDYDSVWFSKQLRSYSMLTLWTLPGDYWIKKGEKSQISNLLVHKIGGNSYSVIVKISSFSPAQSSQQLAMFLFDKNLNRNTWMRFSFIWGKDVSGNDRLQSQTIIYENRDGVFPPNHSCYNELLNSTTRQQTQEIWFRFDIKNNTVKTFFKAEHDWHLFSDCGGPLSLSFEPAYVGIGAFQGWTFDDGHPMGADTIPAFIDYIIFEPIKGQD